MQIVHKDGGTRNRALDSSPYETELLQMNVARPVQVEGIFPALDLDGVLIWRAASGWEEVERVSGTADSFDVEKILSLLIECIKVVPEEIGICSGHVGARFAEGPIAEGQGICARTCHDTGITENSAARAGINPGPSPAVDLAVWKRRVVVGSGKKRALVGRLGTGGGGIVEGLLSGRHVFPVKVKGLGSVRPSRNCLGLPVDQNAGFPYSQTVFLGELDFENGVPVLLPDACPGHPGFNDLESGQADFGEGLLTIVGAVSNRRMRSSTSAKPD